MKDLRDIRREIDAIDDELAALFKKRIEIADEVAACKTACGGAVSDPAREREIISRVTGAVGAEHEGSVKLLFTTLFGITKARQRALMKGSSALVDRMLKDRADKFPSRSVVACAGTEGSYAQQATSLLFSVPTIVFFNDFEKVFEAVEKGLCPYGVLPVENSAAGSVAAVYDLMQKHSFSIVRSTRLKVDHVLLAPKGVKMEDVKEIVSHPHAIAQCGTFLKSLPGVKTTPGPNTAAAAKIVAASGRRDFAAIASRRCAELYGLDIIGESVSDAAFNYTRFICISKNLEIYPDSNKISVMLSLPHRPGSLSRLITRFSAASVNLTKLESRPVPGLDFEFMFIFDFEARPDDKEVQSLLTELATDPEIEHFTFLGAYSET